MLSDTEAPSAPPQWAESIHGDLVLAASWEMASESLLYVFAQLEKGDHHVDVASDRGEGDLRFRTIRLRPVA